MAKTLIRNLFFSNQPNPFFCFKTHSYTLQASLNTSMNLPKSAPVLNCLKSYGFDDSQIAKLVERRPGVLHCRVSSNLTPKFEYLIQKGFTGKLLPEFIVSNPLILFRSLGSSIKPCFEFLSPFLNGDELLVSIKRSSYWLLNFNLNTILQPNVDFLISEGVPARSISKLLVLQPRVIMQSHDRMVYAVKTLKEIGFEPKEPKFVHALRVICSMSKFNWEKKVEAFRSLGWSEEEVLNTFRKCPLCLAISEKKLRYLMDFYVNTMKLDSKIIIGYPKMLLFSLDKRISRRYKILKVLQSKKLINEDKKILWVLNLSERKFLEEYISKHSDKVPGLLDMYQRAAKQ
ncbi:hypothetical protein PTKIN_Ptkin16aG0061100 [Pterospermum kingtungense]